MSKDENESPSVITADTTRMSIAPKIIVVAILSAFALVVVYSLATKNQQQEEENKETPKENFTQTTKDYVNTLTANADYTEPGHFEIPTHQDEEFAPDRDEPKEITPEKQKEIIKERPDELELKPDLPPNTAQPDPRFEEYKQLRKQQFMQALTSQSRNSSFNGSNSSSSVIHGNDRSALQRPSSDASYQENFRWHNSFDKQ